ncbi:dynamin family protein [Providencia manganoxydans]
MEFKQLVDDFIPELTRLSKKYDFTDELNDVVKTHNEFKLRFPFIGSFSTGKSTLINTFLDDKLLGVQVTPETCLPTEIRYAEHESINLCNSDGVVSIISREQLKEQDFPLSDSNRDYWVEITLPNESLKPYPELTLVDMPGWESGIQAHSQAIDNYISRSGTYCIVVSAEDGTLKQSMKQVLQELKLFRKPISLVVSKCDKRLPEEIDAIVSSVKIGVENISGQPPIVTIATSARKKQVSGFEQMLQKVIEQSDIIYYQSVGYKMTDIIERIQRRITTQMNNDNLTIEQIRNACAQIPLELAQIQQQLSTIKQQIDDTIPSCLNSAKNNLEVLLRNQLSSLTDALRFNGDMNGIIGNTLREAFITVMEQEFKPTVARKMNTLQDCGEFVPSNIDITHGFKQSDSLSDLISVTSIVTFVVSKLITLIPQLKIIGHSLTAIATLFTSSAKEKIKNAEQQEEAQNYVIKTLIPQIISRAEPEFRKCFYDMSEEIKAELDKETQQKAEDKKQSLQILEKSLLEEQQADDAKREEFARDNTTLSLFKENIARVVQ